MSMLTEFHALVAPIVEGRIVAQAHKVRPPVPYITYFRPTNTEENTIAFNGGAGNKENTRLQVDIFSERYEEAYEVAGLVKAAMKGWNISNIKTMEQDLHEDDTGLHRVLLEFSVRHT